jgi:hypothetical protein
MLQYILYWLIADALSRNFLIVRYYTIALFTYIIMLNMS